MRERFKLVITHRFRRSISTSEMRENFPFVPFLFYPDAGTYGLKRFAPGLTDLLDIILCLLALPRIRSVVAREKPDRLFVLVGGSAWFLVIAWLISKAAGLPTDIFLVDDLTHSAHLARRKLLPKLVPFLESWVLRGASRVFGISPGFAEHLTELHGVPARWMPTPIHADELVHHPFVPASPDVRTILFIGACNALYCAPLLEIYAAIQQWNRTASTYKLRLRILSPGNIDPLRKRLPDEDDLDVILFAPGDEIARQARTCWATFLPYSFGPEVRTLVSTSFSWKLSDSYRSGRPILVYGPAYASIPRYFLEENLPLCATCPEALLPTIASIERLDTPALIDRYATVWRRHHSAEAVERNLSRI